MHIGVRRALCMSSDDRALVSTALASWKTISKSSLQNLLRLMKLVPECHSRCAHWCTNVLCTSALHVEAWSDFHFDLSGFMEDDSAVELSEHFVGTERVSAGDVMKSGRCLANLLAGVRNQ